MSSLKLNIGEVIDVEDSKNDSNQENKSYDGLRIKAKLPNDKTSDAKIIPWAFPLLPKTFQSIPKIGEAVIILNEDSPKSQRYYIGPIISQPQYNTYAAQKNGTSLLQTHDTNPLERISNNDKTIGSFPKSSDVAIVGRGAEDIILRANNGSPERTKEVKESEIQLRAGIRSEATNESNPNMIGNIIFNGTDPAYIQLKHKKGLTRKKEQEGNSVINMVANRINIMSNKDDNINDNLKDKNLMIADNKMDEIMDNLHQVPMGDKLVELLKIMKGCIMHHVHPWAGMEQCGDWGGYINKLDGYDIDSILSKYVRIS